MIAAATALPPPLTLAGVPLPLALADVLLPGPLALAALQSPLHLDGQAWLLFVVAGTFLAGVHAYRKLSPYFAITWFGAGLVFGWFWTDDRARPETLLLPALLVYVAAAVTKGLVEQGRFAGVHVVHVLAAGLFTALIALPLESAAAAMDYATPRGAPGVTHGVVREEWLGGVSADMLVQWSLVGTLFYGLYKLLDHLGLGPALQTVLLFACVGFLVPFAEYLMRLMA